MKLQRSVTKHEEVEVELPFYFSQYLDRSAIYGRVDEHQTLTVHEADDAHCYEVEIKQEHAQHYVCYLTSHYSCQKQTFDDALARAKAWVNSLHSL